MADLFTLSTEEKEWLLKAARASIAKTLGVPGVDPGEPPEGIAKLKTGVFVTLHKRGQLRGCIGMIESRKPLGNLVREIAVSSATSDPRFTPMIGPEIEEADIEISVLGPPQKISGVDDIVVGRDGLIVENGPFRGLLLPQVAMEWGWDAHQFLEHTCQKAGLENDAWKSKDTRIYHFQAEVFGEKQLKKE